MKKVFYVLGTIVVAALTFTACNREELDTPEQSGFTHTVKINATYGIDTKTAIVEGADQASFVWSADDAGRFTVKENDVTGTNVQLALTNENATGVLSATFASEEADSYVYSAYLVAPNNKTSGGSPKIPASQTPTESSYDPDADILVAKSLTFDTQQTELNMQFARPVVINKMTLKGLTAGETVSTVAISGGETKIIGYYSISTGIWEGQGTDITVDVNRTVPTSGELVVYFVTMPAEGVTLTVTATTSESIYTKTFTKTINFVENQVTVFGVSNMNKTQKKDYSGTYVLTNVAGTKMANKWDGNNIPAVDVTSEEGVIYYDPDVVTLTEAQITISRITDSESEYYNMYTIVQNGKYLYAASSDNNYLKGEDEPDENAYWEISERNGEWSIVASKSKNRNNLRNNGSIFSCYASGQNPVALYDVKNVKTTPVISGLDKVALESDAVDVWTELNANIAFNNDVTTVTANAYSDETCTTSCSWLSADVDGTVVYKVAANNTGSERTAYIEIIATNSDGRSVSKIVEVIQRFAGAEVVTYSLFSGDLTEGDYIIYYSGKAMKNTIASNRFEYVEVTPVDNKITNPDASIVWHIAPNGDYWTIYNTSVEKFACGNGTKNQATLYASENYNNNGQGLWTVTVDEGVYDFVNKRNTDAGANANLRNNGTYGFACYSASTGGKLSLYKLN